MDVSNSDNSEEDFEDEEMLVYLDFQSKIKCESLEEQNLKIKMIGLETDEPVIQINNKMFRGTFEHAMGTNVFFTEDTNPSSMDPNFETIPSTMYKYFTQTDKVLKMERLFVTPNKEIEEDELIETQSDEDVVPNESYLEALNQFLAPGQLPPRTLSGSDILKPVEFQSFFRPQLNQVVDDEQSERMDEQTDMLMMENNDKNEGAASGSDSTEINMHQVKIETIKQEQQ